MVRSPESSQLVKVKITGWGNSRKEVITHAAYDIGMVYRTTITGPISRPHNRIVEMIRRIPQSRARG